jgi:hypothetical protein
LGVNSAPELYQHVLRQVLQDCPGSANIADDIIVHGANEEEHDNRLLKVFERLSEVGLTLNKEKCSFKMSQLEFMGIILSARGMAQPSHEWKQSKMPEDHSQHQKYVVSWNGEFQFKIHS